MTLKDLMNAPRILLDGGMGTMLQQYGMQPGEKTELMNFKMPEAVCDIQKAYVSAGSDIICSNTFGANGISLADTGYTVQETVEAAMGIAKRAASGKALVALDMGPLGQMLEPYGDMTEDAAYGMFRELACSGEKSGADLIIIETMSDINEMRLAVRASKENTSLPVFATMTFNKSGRTYMGTSPEQLVQCAEEMEIDAVGINCSLEPEDIFPIAAKIAGLTKLPVIAKPNAGLPKEGKYALGAEKFAEQMRPFVDAGIKIIGGCCGTRPEYIEYMYKLYK